MGLGKTIQVIAFLAALRKSRLRDIGFSYVGLGTLGTLGFVMNVLDGGKSDSITHQ